MTLTEPWDGPGLRRSGLEVPSLEKGELVMAQVVFDFPPSIFSALRKAPAEFAAEMRLAAALHWFSQGLISQGKAAEIAGLSRAELLDELFRRKIPAVQVTLDELREELARGE
jgi:hypothetical protein